ncbi:PREDICTED: uncharacterized protein LOC106110568 [Papilio polytes]|uniref:uncharacterized protein LOC106110568 n=1 Tax=Papilio polytes TaxID=76194 RepID=UPI000675D591|nr:PREDICTED: uncharacterized protein LOC106110568 [Papilio polytes]XP_013147905.1 PREDICTED: uncharacterized protein LOC106110568 [Papilio polytes]XP_013147913.1 PREDICTED: uncharacterized protein LOC106110568 [Papilio polytes]
MSTNDDKTRLSKLLQDLEVPEERLPERCRQLVKDLQEKFPEEITDEQSRTEGEEYVNPYIPDKGLLEENERKLRELLGEEKRTAKVTSEESMNTVDPKRPWRTNSCKEKLLRIESDLKRLKSTEKTGSIVAVEDDCETNLSEGDVILTDPTGVQ